MPADTTARAATVPAKKPVPSTRLLILTVLLTFTAGGVDVICFLRLGEVFASVMTGNMVLLGLAAGTADGELAIDIGVAFLGYVVGTLVGSLVAKGGPSSHVWPARVTVAVGIELVLLAGLLAVWLDAGDDVEGSFHVMLLLCAATAMGIQSAAVTRLGLSGLSTTYMTGTLTVLLTGLVTGRHGTRLDSWGLARLLALIAGAAGGAVLVETALPWAPVLPVCALSAVVVAALLPMRR